MAIIIFSIAAFAMYNFVCFGGAATVFGCNAPPIEDRFNLGDQARGLEQADDIRNALAPVYQDAAEKKRFEKAKAARAKEVKEYEKKRQKDLAAAYAKMGKEPPPVSDPFDIKTVEKDVQATNEEMAALKAKSKAKADAEAQAAAAKKKVKKAADKAAKAEAKQQKEAKKAAVKEEKNPVVEPPTEL